MTEINQKEYLKKYLGIGKAPGEKKKKKKKLKGVSDRVKIIDDDANTNAIVIEDDPFQQNENEDAPQIVAIIDERPPSLRVDDKTKSHLWQPIGSVDDNEAEHRPVASGFKVAKLGKNETNSSNMKKPNSSNDDRVMHIKKEKEDTDNDFSPPRRHRDDDDYSPPRKRNKQHDNSPPRKSRMDKSRPRNDRRNSDNSPPRKARRDDGAPPERSRRDSDNSPPRKGRRNDNSPPQRTRRNSDNSPPRKGRRNDNSPPQRTRRNSDNSPPRKGRRNDNSPPQRTRRNSDNSPPRKGRRNDNSPPQRTRRDSDNSPPRKIKEEPDCSPPRRSKRDNDNSPPRKNKSESVSSRKSRWSENTGESSKKLDKTLDGKRAGLQDAKQLIEETKQFREREDQLFKNLSKDVSGENAQTVQRDRKTGRIRNIEEEEARKRKKQEEENKNKEKYARWGRGLAQVESREQRIQEELHEMSKPLARYADDEDLEKYLKEQEREGDPMLAYIRSKRRKEAAKEGKVEKPQFEGEFMPNRFGIRPGHRWDGVDRSNGYEKKWFEVQNAKTAQMEDTYKWSTEDM